MVSVVRVFDNYRRVFFVSESIIEILKMNPMGNWARPSGSPGFNSAFKRTIQL